MRRVRLTASGRVQGVFFRASVRDEARRRAVTGWVSNEPDGRVAAEVQGAPEDVEAMISFCRDHPGQSQVHDLAVEELPVRDHEQEFRVR